MLAYDPGYILSRLEIPHIRSTKPVDFMNFVDYLDIDSYKEDKPFFCIYGEILPSENKLAVRKPIALISAATYEEEMPFPIIFYPEHMIMTYKINHSLDRLRPITVPRDKPFLADVLMGHHKMHRWQIVNRIISNGLEDRCLISLKEGPYIKLKECDWMKRQFPKWGYPRNIISQSLDQFDDPEIIKLRSLDVFDSTTKVESMSNAWVSRILPNKIYDASWISIVAETNCGNHIFFPTEKIAKPLIDGRLFLAIGSKDYLKNLRNIGFETFYEFIDESYDKYESQYERVDKMIQTLIELSKENMYLLYKKILPILTHNQMHARSMQSMTSNLESFLLGCEIGVKYQPKS
jgi:hypothetical protein